MGIGGETVARLKAVVTVDNTGLKRGLAESETATERSTTKMQGLFKKAGQVSAIGFAVVGAAMYEGVKGAVALQQKFAVLDKQLKNAGISAHDTADASKYLEEQSNKTGFAIGDLTDSFGKSVTALGSYKKAQAETALAENIARATGETLVMANKQAIKVYEGKNTALSKLGVVLPKITSAEDKLKATNKNATAAEKAHAKAIDAKRTAVADAKAATDKYKGATDAYGKTLAGQLTLTENRFKNMLDTLGAKLLPVITSVFGFMAGHTNILIGVGAALLGIWAAATLVTAAVKAYAAYTKIAAAVQWLWNAAMDANPVGLLVIAIAALVAGVVLAYRHFKGFREAINGVWNMLGNVWAWIKGNWPLLLAVLTGPFGMAVYEIRKHWDTIKTDAGDVVSWFSRLPGKMASAVGGLWSAIPSTFDNAINSVISAWNNLSFKVGGGSEFGVSIPSFTLNTPNIPLLHLADGGRVAGGTPGRDSVPAMLTPGEIVLNGRQQDHMRKRFGLDVAHVLGFASGGLVPPYEITRKGPRDYVLNTTEGQKRIPNYLNEGEWFYKFIGKGISLAQMKYTVVPWWRNNFAKIAQGYAEGGMVRQQSGDVHVHQTIMSQTDDQGVHMRRARHAAQAAFG